MNDLAQLNLREPEIADWDSWGKSSSYLPPPQALNQAGKYLAYYGVAEKPTEKATQFAVDDEGNAYLNFSLDPIKITRGDSTGYIVRFAEASVKPFTKMGPDGNRVAIKGNPNQLGNYLRACGLVGVKPQTNDQYRAAVRATLGKAFPFVGDWEAKSKETGEVIRGYLNFPDDPKNPGNKKAILKAGDFYTIRDKQGSVIETKQVIAETIFANFKLKYFEDPTRGQK